MNDIEFSQEQRNEAARPLFTAILNIFEAWGLDNKEQQVLLGFSSEAIFQRWKEKPESLSDDLLKRTSHILGIWKALQILIPDEKISDSWITSANLNPVFNGQRPLDRMLLGNIEDLAFVRQYLDSQLN